MKRYLFIIILCFFLGPWAHAGSCLVFGDPDLFYETVVPKQWVYQAQRSTNNLTVFYGQGEHDLLYFEYVGPILETSVEDFAERTLSLYAQPGGLKQFELIQPLVKGEMGGLESVSCVYTYQTRMGTTLWEYRVFVLLPGQEGFSIALGGDEKIGEDGAGSVLNDILAHWRWLD